MTEFQELIQDAPNFVSMERGELVAYAYGMFAAGTKADAENAKLRELVRALLQCHVEDTDTCAKCSYRSPLHGGCMADVKADELGVEVTS